MVLKSLKIIPPWYVLLVYYRRRSEGDNALGSVRPSVRLFVLSRLNRLCVSNQGAYTDNSADAVDRRFNFTDF